MEKTDALKDLKDKTKQKHLKTNLMISFQYKKKF